jgi:predicted ATPase/DNA-binding winged helix-turn-helix (wHTH) protein
MTEPYCFGRFTLYPDKRQLHSDGVPTSVGATAVTILLALVEQAGTVVSKDDLMLRVWGRSAVGEHRLHVHVYELRKAIGDDFITTKSGRGYRFIAPVRRLPTPPAEAAHPEAHQNCGNPRVVGAAMGDSWPVLIGRNEELQIISRHLADGRLVTLTGPGGVGKTSLAQHVAKMSATNYQDGVWIVGLAALKDPALVPTALATVLGIKIGHSDHPRETVARQLARRTLLIVLDNCEHVVKAAAELAEAVLEAAPGVKILATSREPLSCRGEQVLEIPPLALPKEGIAISDIVRDAPAVELFLERARAADSRFHEEDEDLEIAARICRRLDGLPLAIEMAAGWAGVLGLEALEAKLGGSLNAWLRARSTAPHRHSTLRATLEWSHDLLSTPEQAVLRRIAVFAGTFSMTDAEAVASDHMLSKQEVFEQLASLVRKSMVAVESVSRVRRYRLLETTRAFAREMLASSPEANDLKRQHARFVLHRLELAIDEWETTSDSVWFERYRWLLDDLRACLDWAMTHDTDKAVAIAGASWPIWREFSLHVEGRERLAAAVRCLHSGIPPIMEARLRRGLGELWTNTGTVRSAQDEFARAVDLYRTLEDVPNLGAALSRLAFTQIMLGSGDEAEQSISKSLSLLGETRLSRSLSSAYLTQIIVEARLGRYAQARAVGEKAMRLSEAIGAERACFVVAGNLMEIALEQGDVDGAVQVGRELAQRLRDDSNFDVQAYVLGLMATALIWRGDLEESLTAASQAAPLLRDEGMLFTLFDQLALRAGLAGRPADAARIIGYTNAIYRGLDRPREPVAQSAENRLMKLLGSALPAADIAQLASEGAALCEDHVLTLALRD